MILTETNITDQAYCCNILGYHVVCFLVITTASGGAQGGVGLVFQDRPQVCSLESTRFHGKNLVSYDVVKYKKQNPIIAKSLPPYTLDHLPDLEEGLTRFRNQDLTVLGDLNTDTDQAHNPCS